MVMGRHEYEKLAKQLKESTGTDKVLGYSHRMFKPRKWLLVELETIGECDMSDSDGGGTVITSGPVHMGQCAAMTAHGAFEHFRPDIMETLIESNEDCLSSDKVYVSDLLDTEVPDVKLVVASVIRKRHPYSESPLAPRNVVEFYIMPSECYASMHEEGEERSDFLDF